MSKKVKLFFTLSFLLNIILIGVVSGSTIKKNKYHSPALEKVNPETRKIFKESIKQNHENMRDSFEQMRAHKKTLKAIITAEEFDQPAFDSAMQKVLMLRNTMETQKAQTLGNVLSSLNKVQREEMAEHILRKISGKRHGSRKGGKRMKNKEKTDE